MKWRLMVAFMAVTFLVVVVQDIPLGSYLERVERERIVTALERDAFLLAGRSEDTLEAATSVDPRVVADVHRYRQASGARVVIVNAAGDAVVTSDDDQSAAGSSTGRAPRSLRHSRATSRRDNVIRPAWAPTCSMSPCPSSAAIGSSGRCG